MLGWMCLDTAPHSCPRAAQFTVEYRIKGDVVKRLSAPSIECERPARGAPSAEAIARFIVCSHELLPESLIGRLVHDCRAQNSNRHRWTAALERSARRAECNGGVFDSLHIRCGS